MSAEALANDYRYLDVRIGQKVHQRKHDDSKQWANQQLLGRKAMYSISR